MNDKAFLGVGWHFPISADEATGRIKTSEYEDNIAESIRMILQTRKGERVLRPDFGTMLSNYVFEDFSLSSLSMMADEVKNSLTEWEPRIKNIEVSAVRSDENPSAAVINISYVVRVTNSPFNIVFPFYLNENS